MNSSDVTNFDRQFKHQTAEVNGVSIHYAIGGEGEAVVLLHGFAQTWNDWYFEFINIAYWGSTEAWRSTHADYHPGEADSSGFKGHPAIYESIIDVRYQDEK